ncbi:hydroxymethylpyrimidine/phosphomethylpyrimidine kinase [uncultured Chryseobacterium sp.]|uniref:hydroxymethylpyrimidine/phosphomethylpyrimidine kinase n=1 Tax=uncultured Chryseobacterium sp. TaxID=259322 RepID=UPI0025D0C189|nr:hydroxymethylpyrimidine/phosphomethylpyrimidine kinase [uncultured Chryseobacterium sp.]
MQEERPFVMTIAGFDPSGGAGILADCKTFEQLKVQGLAVCTAVTIQTENKCLNMEWQPLEQVTEAIQVLLKAYPVKAVKIGVVKDAEFLNEIIRTVKLHAPEAKIVWDPVLKSTSEFTFFDLNTVSQLKNILNQMDLITPNYNEYRILQNNNLFSQSGSSYAVLIKGGHRKDSLGTDILREEGREIAIYPNETTLNYYPKHGSGCVLSSAITAHLAKGEDREAACRKGKEYIEKFLTDTPGLLGFHS